jgi:plastocyanin
MSVTSVRVLLAGAAAAALVVGPSCSSGGGGTAPPPTPAIAMTATSSGNGQTAQVGTLLPNPLRVVVTLSGAAQVGTTVSWAAQGAGASVGASTSLTDASGIATATWTLGSTAGTQNATATLAGASGSPVTFSATATAAPVPLIAKTASASGDAQSGTVATALANPLRVLVTLSGAPQVGDTVAWAAIGTGSSVTPLKSVTDASGIATTSWTLGQTAGAQSATASLAGATGSPVTFGATAAAAPATQLTLASGNNQSAQITAAFASPLAVKVADQFGNGVAGDSVSWLVTVGSSTVLPAKSASGANGIAQASLTAAGVAEAVTITATKAGLAGSPVTFNATVTTAPTTATVSIGSFFFKSARNNSQNPAVDTIAVNGTVTWNFTGGTHGVQSTGSPSFTGQTVSQSTGSFQFTFTVAGTYTYDCLVHGSLMTGAVVVK